MIRRALRYLRPHLILASILASILAGGMAASPLWQVTG